MLTLDSHQSWLVPWCLCQSDYRKLKYPRIELWSRAKRLLQFPALEEHSLTVFFLAVVGHLPDSKKRKPVYWALTVQP